MKNLLIIMLLLGFSSAFAQPTRPTGSGLPLSGPTTTKIVYVKNNATGANNGTSWADAYTDLQAAIDGAASIRPSGRSNLTIQVWVAAGTYKPTKKYPNVVSTNDRDRTFSVKSSSPGAFPLYGGFVGTETELSQRNHLANPTILSGDIGTVGDSTDNCYHVISSLASTQTRPPFLYRNITHIDGFIVEHGNANGAVGTNESCGGGIFMSGEGTNFSNMTVRNNWATNNGGGVYLFDDYSEMINMTIQNNWAANKGGGIFINADTKASISGGVARWKTPPFLINALVTNNSANKGGGVCLEGANFGVCLINLTIASNSANEGGGVHGAVIRGKAHIKNSIIWNNGGSEVFGSLSYADCIVKNSGGSSNWNTNYGVDEGRNLDADPLFVNATNFKLQAGSPAINAGKNHVTRYITVPMEGGGMNNSVNRLSDQERVFFRNTSGGLNLLPLITTDVVGNPRVQGGTIDMGAHEN